MLLKGFKTKLNPNNKQRSLLAQHAGCARWAYNWGLQQCFQAIEARNSAIELGEPLPKFPTAIDLHSYVKC